MRCRKLRGQPEVFCDRNRGVHLGIKKNQHASIYCPQYENISVKGMLESAEKVPVLMEYLPDVREIHLLPR